jgi:hypothetical protein
MIRVLRSGSLLVSFSLLASAATANAECACGAMAEGPSTFGLVPGRGDPREDRVR